MRLNAIQISCAATLVLFLILGYKHFGTEDGIPGLSGGGFSYEQNAKGSMKTIMAKSEAIWQKTIDQRKEVMAKFGDIMGL